MKMITIVPRVVISPKEFKGEIELYYYSLYSVLTVYNPSEGHGQAGYEYYLKSTRPLKTEEEISKGKELYDTYVCDSKFFRMGNKLCKPITK